MEVRREPFGVILIIAPSHYPLFLPGVQTLQALAAGNAVLLKPGRDSQQVALAFVDLLGQAGIDPRLVRVLPETPAVAAEVIAHGIDKVILTGKTDTGAAVLAALAPKLTPATLELSGCDAAFVCADADIGLVVEALQFSLRFNAGATCIAPRRVLVQRTLADALETQLVQVVSQLEPSHVGANTSSRVQALVAEACQQGARQLTGAVFPNHTMTPVVVADASPTMRLLSEDVFAPILTLIRVNDLDEALSVAKRCPYALGATVFGHPATARVFAQRINAGVVVVNDVIVPTADPRLPFGGRGRSGYGVTRGAEGLLDLTVPKAIAVRHGRWRPHYAPSQPDDVSLFHAYITAAQAGSWPQRMAALGGLFWALVKRGRERPLPHTEDASGDSA
jgi:acyl-CoA reductase-like NAD-dependent aldehyde dehydrogenase